MKIYEIRKYEKEFSEKEKNNIVEGCTFPDCVGIISTHETLAEAIEAFKKCGTTARTYSGGAGKYIGVTEYSVVSYDPDEFVQSVDVHAFTKMVDTEEFV